MAFNHVSQTGKPAAAWKYHTSAFTLRRSWALKSCMDVSWALGAYDSRGKSSGLGS